MRFRDFDVFKKLPRELTVGTRLGGFFSLLTLALLACLVIVELRATAVSTASTQLALDRSDRANPAVLALSISFPEVPCEFLHVDVLDQLAEQQLDVAEKMFTKRDFDAPYKTKAFPSPNEVVQFDGNGRIFIPPPTHVTASSGVGSSVHKAAFGASREEYDAAMRDAQFAFVYYFTPWCPHCRNMMPAWSKLSQMVDEARKFGSSGGKMEISSDLMEVLQPVDLLAVDCSRHIDICTEAHVVGVPLLRMYHLGAALKPDFRGNRTADRFAQFASELVNQNRRQNSYKSNSTSTSQKSAAQAGSGCTIHGAALIHKAPGFVRISARVPEDQSVDHPRLNVSHVVHQCSVSDHASASNDESRSSFALTSTPLDRRRFPELLQRNVKPLNGQMFRAMESQRGLSFDHYLKLVRMEYRIRSKRPEFGYQMVATSHAYYKEHGAPEVRFSYDVSPMKLVVEIKNAKQWYEFVTKLCAILGGVLTVLGLVDKTTYAMLNKKKKNREGKLT